MSELLNEEEVEMEVTDEYGEVIYIGTYEEFLALNDYNEELEDVLNKLQNTDATQISFYGFFAGFFASEYIIRKVA